MRHHYACPKWLLDWVWEFFKIGRIAERLVAVENEKRSTLQMVRQIATSHFQDEITRVERVEEIDRQHLQQEINDLKEQCSQLAVQLECIRTASVAKDPPKPPPRVAHNWRDVQNHMREDELEHEPSQKS